MKSNLLTLMMLMVLSRAVYSGPSNDYEEQDRTNIIDEKAELMAGDYRPFDPKSKIARLNEESTLRFKNHLPRLDGATALMPVYSAFVAAVCSEEDFHDSANHNYVAYSTTPGAYYSLIVGNHVDIIFCFEPSDEQRQLAQEKGVTLNMTPLGKEAFVFFVNKDNPVSGLSSAQIKAIYSGKITNWKDAGGNDADIAVYQRDKNSGSQTILESIMAGDVLIEPVQENVIWGMRGMVEAVAASYRNAPNAIGYSFLFYATEMLRNNGIKLLAVDGVYPSTETIQSGGYQFTQTFYAITRGEESKEVKEFIQWMLSEQGQYIIKETGYVPIK